MKKGEEGSGDLSKKSLNGMLGPGDVSYDEEGFVIEREEAEEELQVAIREGQAEMEEAREEGRMTLKEKGGE